MKAFLQRGGKYVKSRDTLSWFLVIVGSVVIAMLAESIRLHREVGPAGGHHGDIAGGLSMLGFQLSMIPFILVFAGIGALFGKSTMPLIGAILGVIASTPVLLVFGILGALLSGVSPFLGVSFPFLAGIGLVVMGLLRKTKKTMETGADVL